MAFTRQYIRNLAKESGIELPKEMEESLIAEHISARDTYAEEKVQAAMKENPAPKPEDTDAYKTLKKQFEDYQAEVTAKETRAAKESAYRTLLAEAGIDPKRIDTVIRAEKAGFDGLKLNKDGKFDNAAEIAKSIKTDWADFITTTETTGVNTAKPPVPNKKTYTTEDISKMSAAEINKNWDSIKASLEGEL